MSYSLSISGHHNEPAVAEQIDTLVAEKGAEIVAAVLALDPSAVAMASFSGPSGYRNYLAEVAEDAAKAEPDPEAE